MSDQQDKNILVIDDDQTFNRILSRALSQRGYLVRSATGAIEGLAAAEAHHPSRVILDLNLNGESGLQLIPALLLAVPGVSIVVLTGYASIATAVHAIKIGATEYLSKPTDVGAILAAFGDGPAPADVLIPEQPMSVDRIEWEHIQRVLAEHAGNISATARALNMHRRTLQRKLQKRPVKS